MSPPYYAVCTYSADETPGNLHSHFTVSARNFNVITEVWCRIAIWSPVTYGRYGATSHTADMEPRHIRPIWSPVTYGRYGAPSHTADMEPRHIRPTWNSAQYACLLYDGASSLSWFTIWALIIQKCNDALNWVVFRFVPSTVVCDRSLNHQAMVYLSNKAYHVKNYYY